MSAVAAPVEVVEGGEVVTEPSDPRMSLRESATLAESPFNADGTVTMYLIRPGVGRGRGTRYYSPDMLRENAHKFSGKRMFLNHLTSKEERELEGLPRKVEQLAGRIVEAWWDDSTSASGQFEQGAVMAKVRPLKPIRDMMEDDPEILEASINAKATGLRTGRMGGRIVSIVEGIRDKPITVDFVSEGGAGGRIASLLEAEDQEMALLESMNNTEVSEYLEQNRPELLKALREGARHEPPRQKEDEVGEITAEALTESLTSPEGQAALGSALQEALKNVQIVDPEQIGKLVESSFGRVSEDFLLDARANFNRRTELLSLEQEAHRLIESARLHPRLARTLRAKFSLTEAGEPTEALNVLPETDASGEITKPADAVLREAVNAEIAEARELMAELAPTRVRGQGRTTTDPKKLQEGRKPEDGKEEEQVKTTGSGLADEVLLEAGFSEDALSTLYAA